MRQFFRNEDEFRAWSYLFDLCEDECQVIKMTPAMRQSILKVEKILAHLCRVEQIAIDHAMFYHQMEVMDAESDEWYSALDNMGQKNDDFLALMKEELPEAFELDPITT